MNLIVASLVTLGVIGCVAAIVLYFVAQKFKVVEDPRIDQVEAVLPGANCGGCGFPGCRGFADACVKAGSLEGKSCPVGGGDTMTQIAGILGLTADVSDPKVAVLRCSGSCANRPRTTSFDGAKSCKVVAQLYAGETGCFFGCTGLGDCVSVCSFDAIKINPATGLPEVDEEKCTSCGACIKECPKNLLELRKKGIKSRRVFVSCANKDKGGVARKACSSACIGCGKCQKACPFDAITIENNLAYIDADKCKLCRKCVVACPTGAIVDINFPTPPPQPKPAAPKPAPAAKADAAPEAKPAAPAPKPVVAPAEPITPQPEIAKPEIAQPVTPVAPIPEQEEIKVVVKEVAEPVAVAEPVTVAEPVAVVEPEIVVEVKPEEPKTETPAETPVVAEPVAVAEPKTETPAAEVEAPEEAPASSINVVEIPDNIDVTELIDPELRVVPREREVKPKAAPKKKVVNKNQSSLDL